MEQIVTKVGKPEKYSAARSKLIKKGNTAQDIARGHAYVQMEINSNNPLMISSNTNQKVRSRSSLDANEALNKDAHSNNAGSILTSRQYAEKDRSSPNSFLGHA